MIKNLQKMIPGTEQISVENQISLVNLNSQSNSVESLNFDLLERSQQPTVFALEHGGVKSPL